jgi:uncharacterized YigZ family protein
MDLFSDTYKILAEPVEGIYKDKGSKFIAKIFPVKNEEEIKSVQEKLRSEYFDARHHCYAWILGADKSAYRINDDGEPSGSAGKPIYNQLLSHDITYVIAVVIRYFGGTKLGIPGLINAYKEAVKEALCKAEYIELTVNEELEIEYEYPLMDLVMRTLKEYDLKILETKFELNCRVKFSVRISLLEKTLDIFNSIYGVKIIEKD